MLYIKKPSRKAMDEPKETKNVVLTITDSNLDKTIEKYETVVIECWAEWCGPCKMVAPLIEELATEMEGIVFGKLNIDENPFTPLKYQILSIPTLLVFKKGNLVDRIVGAIPKEMLRKKLEVLT
jgi:thioredoxin 1